MTINFNNIPPNLRVPLWYAEVNAAQAPYQSIARLLLIGQMDASGSAEPGKAVRVFQGADGLFGVNSMLARMYRTARLNAPFQEIWCAPLLDDAAGVAATGAIVVEARSDIRVRAATTANVTLAGSAPDAVDGVDLVAGDIVLVKAQTAGAENGIYVVTTLGTGANGTWTRHASYAAGAAFGTGFTVTVMEGTAGQGDRYEDTSVGPVTLGTTAISFGVLAPAAGVVARAETVSIFIGGVRIRVAAYPSDTPAVLAARLVAAINAEVGLPVTAAVSTPTNVIALTARHKGEASNSILVETNYFGTDTPTSGFLFGVVAMSGGSGDPDMTDLLASLGDEEFDWIAAPYSDDTNLDAVGALLNGATGRWSPYKQLYGHYICHRAGTSAALAAYGAGLNDEHVSIMGSYRSPSPSWDWAAAVGAKAAQHLQAAPELSRPLQTIDLAGIYAPKDTADRFDITTRQSLYYDGISGYHVEKDGTVSIDRLITTYQLNEWGSPDPSWLDVNTLAQTMYGLRYLRAKVTGQWGRAALADENPFNIVGMATPEDVRNTIVHGYRELVRLGVFENEDEFERQLIVERNATDATRLDILLPADKVNQLRIIAVNYVSHLQYAAI